MNTASSSPFPLSSHTLPVLRPPLVFALKSAECVKKLHPRGHLIPVHVDADGEVEEEERRRMVAGQFQKVHLGVQLEGLRERDSEAEDGSVGGDLAVGGVRERGGPGLEDWFALVGWGGMVVDARRELSRRFMWFFMELQGKE